MIVDKDGNFVTRRSEALNRQGPSAFRAVEKRMYNLGSYLGDKPSTAFDPPAMPKLRFSVGSRVQCRVGPAKWASGEVTHEWIQARGRKMPYVVQSDDGHSLLVPFDRADLIRPLTEAIEMISTGVHVFDEEHASCAKAMQQLRERLTLDSLRAVREELASHFKHEEEIFAKTGFGNHGTALSGTKSHCDDHAKILSEIDSHLLNSSKVNTEFVESLITHVTKHTKDLDSKYEGHINENAI